MEQEESRVKTILDLMGDVEDLSLAIGVENGLYYGKFFVEDIGDLYYYSCGDYNELLDKLKEFAGAMGSVTKLVKLVKDVSTNPLEV